MNKTSWLVINFLTFLILLLVAAAAQTSLLHWVFGWRPTIQIGIVVLVYITLYRSPAEGLLFTVVACYCTALLSIMLVSLNIFAGICVFLLVQALRTRVFSQSPVYFTWTALGAIFAFHVIAWFTSLIFEVRTPSPHPLDWILEVLITALFTRVLFHFFCWIDRKTKRLSLTELNS